MTYIHENYHFKYSNENGINYFISFYIFNANEYIYTKESFKYLNKIVLIKNEKVEVGVSTNYVSLTFQLLTNVS